ncbi:hypothetical protein Btru_017106 [Bulinus truncatus]|nr:hypothetical protein Btru_017106 [Bulinus truncatus]
MSVSLINRLKRHKHDEDKISRCKIPRHFYKKLDIESEKGSRTESSHSYGSSRHSPAFTGLAQHTNSCEKEFISNYPCSNNDNDVLNLNKDVLIVQLENLVTYSTSNSGNQCIIHNLCPMFIPMKLDRSRFVLFTIRAHKDESY